MIAEETNLNKYQSCHTDVCSAIQLLIQMIIDNDSNIRPKQASSLPLFEVLLMIAVL